MNARRSGAVDDIAGMEYPGSNGMSTFYSTSFDVARKVIGAGARMGNQYNYEANVYRLNPLVKRRDAVRQEGLQFP